MSLMLYSLVRDALYQDETKRIKIRMGEEKDENNQDPKM